MATTAVMPNTHLTLQTAAAAGRDMPSDPSTSWSLAATSLLSRTLHDDPTAFISPSSSVTTTAAGATTSTSTSTPALRDTALTAIRDLLDPLAAEISDLHARRTAEVRSARSLTGQKRSRAGVGSEEEAGRERETKRLLRTWDAGQGLRAKRVVTDGFGVEQVWEQVRRIVDAVQMEVGAEMEERHRGDDEGARENAMGELGESEEDDEGLEEDEDGLSDDEVDEGNDGESEEVDVEDQGQDLDDVEELENEDAEELLDSDDDDVDDAGRPSDEYVADPNGLNDGFFSIDDFNRQSDFLEQADARGGDDGAASDEEDVDWDANPLAFGAANGKTGLDDGDQEDEDGPTFGNMDLNAPEGASDDDEDDDDQLEGGEMDDMDDVTNANNITYKDFFAPPAKKAGKNKKGRPHPHNFPSKTEPPSTPDAQEEDDVLTDGALSRIHRDLFSDNEDADEDIAEDDEKTTEVAPSQRNLSTHERRRLALSKEIATLESTLLSQKPWVLSGEASSSSRPLNSLLEEDLAFERTGKPVPVITAEISADLETLIKSRIVAKDFQDILRRRPDDLATGRSSSGRDRYDLSDAKSKKSLAELYEDDHLRQTTGAGTAEQLTDAQRREQAEIVNLWAEVRGQLDSLSNFSLRPKAPTVSLEIRTDVSVARMEDARPTMGAEAAGTSQLAPGEVYRTGSAVDKDAGEVLVGGRKGLVVSKDEVERGAGKRARRRAKDRAKKKGANEGSKASLEPKKAREEKEVLGQLKRGNVRVIGNKGDITDVDGNRVKAGAASVAGGSFKL